MVPYDVIVVAHQGELRPLRQHDLWREGRFAVRGWAQPTMPPRGLSLPETSVLVDLRFAGGAIIAGGAVLH